MIYEQWLAEWMENYVKTTVKNKTESVYSDIIRLHIKPQLGSYEIKQITPAVLQKFISGLLVGGNVKTGKGLGSNSINGVINVVRSSLKVACVLGLVDENAAEKIRRPRFCEKEITCFTPNEQKLIEKAALVHRKRKMFGVVLCLYMGLRVGELVALKWSDFDLKKGVLTISKTCHDGKDANGKYIKMIETPKTVSSRRIVPIPRQLIPLITKERKNSRSDNVISSEKGEISVRSYQKSFELFLKNIGIKPRGIHALRHTFATRALECGMDVKTLSEILGHKSPTVTLNRYVHSLTEHKKAMMNKLGNLL